MTTLLAERSDNARHASKEPDTDNGTGRHLEVRETVGSAPGRHEVEVFAPDGQSSVGASGGSRTRRQVTTMHA